MPRNPLIDIGLVVAIAILIGGCLSVQSSAPTLTDRPQGEPDAAFGDTVVADPAIVDVPQDQEDVEEQIPAQVWGIISTPQGGVAALAEVSIYRVRFPGWFSDGERRVPFLDVANYRSDWQLSWLPIRDDLDGALEPISQTDTDDHGRYQFHGLDRGRYLVAAVADGTLLTPAQQIIDLAESAQRRDVVLLPGATLTVETHSAGGQEEDCRVIVRGSLVDDSALLTNLTRDEILLYMLNHPMAEGRTDAEGRVQFRQLPPLEYTVYADKQPWVRASQQLTLFDVHEVNIELVSGAVIDGLVVTTGGVAVEGASVTLVDPDLDYRAIPRPLPESVSDAAGGVRLQGILPGRYDIRTEAKGFIEGRISAIEVELDETIPVEVVLKPGAAIRGIVRDQAGSPLPDIQMRVGSTSPGDFSSTRAHTDESGHFSIDTLEPGEYNLTCAGSGWRRAGPGWIRHRQRVETGPDLVEVTLAKAPMLSGRVINQRGEPISGARIASRHPNRTSPGHEFSETYSDSEGHFQLLLEMGGEEDFYVIARGFTRLHRRIDEAVRDLGNLVLAEAVMVEGRVLSPGGTPVSGAKISASEFLTMSEGARVGQSIKLFTDVIHRSPPPRSETDGSFRLYLPDPDLKWQIWATFPQLINSDRVTVEPGGKDVAGVELVLRRGAEVRGTVTGGGAAVAGASVTLSTRRSFKFSIFNKTVRTDETGQFLVSGFRAGRVFIRARADGFGDSLIEKLVLEDDAQLQIDLELQAEALLEGIVIDSRGTPVSGAEVTLREESGVIRNKSTGVDGRFSIGHLAPGLVDVMARSTRHVASILREIDPARGPVEIVIDPGFELRGIVVDQETRDPISRARVALPGVLDPRYLLASGIPQGRERSVYTSPDGRFSFTGLAADRYEIRVKDGLSVPVSIKTDVPGDDPDEPLVIELDPGGRIIVDVVDPSGAPVAGAELYAWPRTRVREANKGPFTSGSEGRCVLTGLPDAIYHVSIEHPLFLDADVSVEVMKSEGSAKVRVVLEPGATIRGQVYYISGNLVREGAFSGEVTVLQHSRHESRRPTRIKSTAIDASGSYSISGVPAGTFELVFGGIGIDLDPAPRGQIEVTGTGVYLLDLRP